MFDYVKKIVASLSVTAMLAGLTGCSGTDNWSVNGVIENAGGKTILLESVNNGIWNVIDSIVVNNDGSFKFSGVRPSFPDIYRLNLDGRMVYFPIDSIENITVVSAFDNFDVAAVISGSPSAELVQQINDKAAQYVMSKANLDSLKREVATLIQSDWGSIGAYYAINKSVGSMPLFDSSKPFDRSIINAVANIYSVMRPDDPRANMLRNNAVELRRLYSNSAPTSIVAESIPFIDLSLQDIQGRLRTLSEEWGKGKTIVLNFTQLTAPEAAAYNIVLNSAYEKYKDSGLEIFQVSLEDDEFAWAQAARNLPWVAVVALTTGDVTPLVSYDIKALPTTFVISRDGEKMERVENIEQLESTIQRLL